MEKRNKKNKQEKNHANRALGFLKRCFFFILFLWVVALVGCLGKFRKFHDQIKKKNVSGAAGQILPPNLSQWWADGDALNRLTGAKN